jgi:1-deoxy-D-xylulose-5-phosphate reductoisomerase
MKKKIAILGSTGSIGKSTLAVLLKDIKNFDVVLLYANNNYLKLIEQAKIFKARNVYINNSTFYHKVKNALKKTKTKVFTGRISIDKIVSKKIDYTMSCIVGLAGLQPTIEAAKISKTLAIANKEAIICGWSILSKVIKKYKTKLQPVDSEHFSIMELTRDHDEDEIAEIIITASGGPFLNLPKNKFRNIKPNQAINHPNWSMGKKISIDSANLMNKVFEVIEACRIFKFNENKYRVIIHPQSYVHSIIRFKNGLIKMILYDTDMKIPISNTLYGTKNIYLSNKKIDTKLLSKISFSKVDIKKFPSIKLINKCLNLGLATSIIVNASNETLVNLFLDKKIDFLDIVGSINKIFKDKEFKKYAKRKPNSVKEIKLIDKWARIKINDMLENGKI